MIKITYNQISDFALVSAMQKISNTSLPAKVAYDIKKLIDKLTQARKHIGESYQADVLSKFTVKEEGKPDFVPDEKKAEFEKEQEEFGKRVVEIDRPRIFLDQIQNVQLTVREISAISSLIHGEEPVVESAPAPVIPITEAKAEVPAQVTEITPTDPSPGAA
jgi:hypothetical protein